MKQVYLLEGKDSMTIVSEKEKHSKFLGKPLASLNEISGLIPRDQLFLLEQYGAWMEALVKNKIKPLTKKIYDFMKKEMRVTSHLSGIVPTPPSNTNRE